MQNKTRTTSQQHSNASTFFKKLKKDLEDAVDKLETFIMNDVGIIRDENANRMKAMKNQYKQLLKDVGALDSKFNSLENKGQFCQIFCSMKRAQDEIAALEACLLQLQDQNNVTEYVINIKDRLRSLIQEPENMASLELISGPQKAEAVLPSQSTVQQIAPFNHTKHWTKQSATQHKLQSYRAKFSSMIQQMRLTKTANSLVKSQLAVESAAKSKSTEHTKSAAVPEADIRVEDDSEYDHVLPLATQPGVENIAVRKTQETKSTAVHAVDIGVRVEADIEESLITDSVVLPGDKLVIVDYNNSSVKLINLQSKKIVSDVVYSMCPWNITTVTNTKVAVTSPEENTILFINVTDTLTLDYMVKVSGQCHGIACISEDAFVVTFDNPAKVEILSRTGKLLQTVVPEDMGRQLFTYPWYVAMSPDQQTIYISDNERQTVTSLDISGQVKAIYEDDRLMFPYGLIVDRAGMLYVCGLDSINIHQLTIDLDKIQILLQKSDGLENPASVSLNEEQNQLYIGMWNNDTVKVYQLH